MAKPTIVLVHGAFTYCRVGSALTEIEGASHFSMVLHPEVVAGVIRDAVTASVASLAA
jgi:pimeloyl-ACP methyl ester carboxylesterase